MRSKLLFCTGLMTWLSASLFAQCPPRATDTLQINKVGTVIHNATDMGWDLVGTAAYVVPWTPVVANQRSSMFAASFWMGGLDTGNNLHLAAQTYRQSGFDFFPGAFRSSGNYDCDTFVDFGFSPSTELLLLHSTGKIIAANGVNQAVHDQGNLSTTNSTFSNSFNNMIELPNQKIMGCCNSIGAIDTVRMMEAPAFTRTNGIVLQLNHNFSTPVVLSNGMVLIVGLSGAEIYDPLADTSGVITSPSVQHMNSSAITLGNGKTWICGGGSNGINTSELFDPNGNAWSPGPNLLLARTGHALVELPTGEILILGGNNSSTQVELYDPATNSISPFGNLTAPAKYVMATLLANGKVLVTSWYTSSSSNGRLEIFNPGTQTSQLITTKDVRYKNVELPNGNILVDYDSYNFRPYDPIANEFTGNFMYQQVFKVTAQEILQFQTDFSANNVNFANYPDIETWPGNGKTWLSEDHYLAPFVDVNNDGFYRPAIDGDYPCITGDQMLWYIVNDDEGPHTETGGDPIGVQAEISAYAFNCNTTVCPDTALDYTTFYHIELVNKSANNYHDFRVTFWQDADLGDYMDDYVGSDSALGVGFCYNGDNNDGGAMGYGVNPPAIGTVVLAGPDNIRFEGMMFYDNDFSVTGNPTMAQEFYYYMTNRWKDGSSLVNNGTNGYGSGTPTGYMYSGDPGFCGGSPVGWSEVSAGNTPFDRRLIVNTGAANFDQGDTLIYDFAIVWSRDMSNGNFGSVCKLKQDVQAVRTWWEGQSFGCWSLVMGQKDQEAQQGSFSLFPNPAQDEFSIRLFKAVAELSPVKVVNLLGETVAEEWISPGESGTSFDISALPDGLYLVSIFTTEGVQSQSLVIHK